MGHLRRSRAGMRVVHGGTWGAGVVDMEMEMERVEEGFDDGGGDDDDDDDE